MPRTPWVLSFALLATPCVRSAGAEGPAEPAPIVMPTELVPLPDGPPPAGTKPDERRPLAPSVQVELSADRPASLEAELEGVTAVYGELAIGARKRDVAVVRGEGDARSFRWDANGDGTIDDKDGAAVEMKPAEGKGPKSWRAEVKHGGGSFRWTVRETPGGFAGQCALKPVNNEKPRGGQPLAFSETTPPTVTKPPAITGKIQWALLEVDDKKLLLCTVRGEGDELVCLVDDACTGDMGAARVLVLETSPMKRGGRRIGVRWASQDLDLGGRKAALSIAEQQPNAQGSATTLGVRKGQATVDGTAHALVLIDGDFDGAYTGADDWWWFGADADLKRPNPNNMFEGNQPVYRGQATHRLSAVAADGTATVVRTDEMASLGAYLEGRSKRVNVRRWFPQFDADAADFVKSRKLDLSRPKATTPIKWRHVLDLDAAKALAAKEGKPLLVDFEADWCVWCKRLDWCTYPDAAVVAEASKFTAVKINTELDPSDAYHKLKDPQGRTWTGIPAVGVFRPDGTSVHFRLSEREDRPGKPGPLVDHIPGWMKPEDFVKALASAHAASLLPNPPPDAPAEKTATGPGDEPKDKPATPPEGKPGDKPTEKPAEKPTEQPAEKPVAEPGTPTPPAKP